MNPTHPSLHPSARPLVGLLESLSDAAEVAARKAARVIDRRDGHRRLARDTDKPADESATPMWDTLADQLRLALQIRGAKARLARHLGLPRQRISDFVTNRRLPDAEMTLRILHWLAKLQAGRDSSPNVPPDPEQFPPAQNPSSP